MGKKSEDLEEAAVGEKTRRKESKKLRISIIVNHSSLGLHLSVCREPNIHF